MELNQLKDNKKIVNTNLKSRKEDEIKVVTDK